MVVRALVPEPGPHRRRIPGVPRRRGQPGARPGQGRLPADVSATFSMHRSRSAPSGLLEVAEQHDATMIVLGSALAGYSGTSHSAASPTGCCTAPHSRSRWQRADSAAARRWPGHPGHCRVRRVGDRRPGRRSRHRGGPDGRHPATGLVRRPATAPDDHPVPRRRRRVAWPTGSQTSRLLPRSHPAGQGLARRPGSAGSGDRIRRGLGRGVGRHRVARGRCFAVGSSSVGPACAVFWGLEPARSSALPGARRGRAESSSEGAGRPVTRPSTSSSASSARHSDRRRRRARSRGCRLDEIAGEFGTPVLVVAEQAIRQRAREYRAGLTARWPDSQVVFASKAFPCTACNGRWSRKVCGSTSPVVARSSPRLRPCRRGDHGAAR